MTKIRIYFFPKGYTDITCDCVDVIPNKKQCIIHGGPSDGEVFQNAGGAKVIGETAGIQEELF